MKRSISRARRARNAKLEATTKPESCCSVSKEPKYKVKAHYFCMTKAERKVYSRLKVPKSNIWGRKGKKTKVIPIVGLIILLFVGSVWAEPFMTETSYFTRASCLREGTSGICANGQRLVDTDLVAASWDFPLNSYIRVSVPSGSSVVCKVADRGPAKRLYRKGRRLDLSSAAFKALAGGKLDCGVLQVRVERIII